MKRSAILIEEGQSFISYLKKLLDRVDVIPACPESFSYQQLRNGATSVGARAKNQPMKKVFLSSSLIIIAVLLCLVVPSRIFAGGLILDAELRLTYEDNVVGLLSDQQRGAGGGGGNMSSMHFMGRPGPPGDPPYLGSGSGTNKSPADFYATISAEAGGYTDLGKDMSVFAKGFANHSSYNTFTDLDATIGGASTGIVASLSSSVTALASVVGKVKSFGDSQRNSTSIGGTLSLKEKLLPSFWLREFGEYEKNNASSAFFSYAGAKAGIVAGYNLFPKTFLAAGYSYLEQKFDEPSGFRLSTNTFSLSAEQTIIKAWSVGAEYDLQLSRENITGASTTDNIFSVALKYTY